MTTLLTPFEYSRPQTLGEVFQVIDRLQNKDQRFVFSGGGTDVIPLLKNKNERAQTVISLAGLQELKQIKLLSPNKLQIGALVSLASLVNNRDVQQLVPALAKSARMVASPQIRNQATIGGNILVTNRCLYFNQSELNREAMSPCFKADGDVCHVVKSAKRGKLPLCRARIVSDTVPVLLLLDAVLVLTDPRGERRVRLKDLYLSDGIYCKDIQPDEVLVYIEIVTSPTKKIRYEKLTQRNAMDFPSMGIAVGVETLHEGERNEYSYLSVALSGVHTHPELLEFCSQDHGSYREMVTDACKQATRHALTFQQDLFPRGYRKKMVEVYLRRAIKNLTGDLWI
jgi:4-hydroxybenzoyl-CoA reductase subunit beta